MRVASNDLDDTAELRCYVQFNKYTLIPPWEDQCECYTMTRMTGPDCAVMCYKNRHTNTTFPASDQRFR